MTTLAIIATINCLGIRTAKFAQMTFTVLKISAVSFIVGCGIVALIKGQHPSVSTVPAPEATGTSLWGALGAMAAALTPIMFTYGGWQTASFVSAEMRDPRRDLSRAMIYGMLGVITLYLTVVGVCLLVLGAPELAATKAPAKAVVDRITGGSGGTILSTFVCIATFGPLMQGLFTVPRLYQAMAGDGLFFRRGRIHLAQSPRPDRGDHSSGKPLARSLLLRERMNRSRVTSSRPISSSWALVAIALLIFRHRGVGEPNTYRMPGGAWTAVFFLLACFGIVAATVAHDPVQLVGRTLCA